MVLGLSHSHDPNTPIVILFTLSCLDCNPLPVLIGLPCSECVYLHQIGIANEEILPFVKV